MSAYSQLSALLRGLLDEVNEAELQLAKEIARAHELGLTCHLDGPFCARRISIHEPETTGHHAQKD